MQLFFSSDTIFYNFQLQLSTNSECLLCSRIHAIRSVLLSVDSRTIYRNISLYAYVDTVTATLNVS